MERNINIDFLKVDELVNGASNYMEFIRVLLSDAVLINYLNADNALNYAMYKKTALCKFEMLQEFATNLNKHIRGLEQCIGEASKEEKRG